MLPLKFTGGKVKPEPKPGNKRVEDIPLESGIDAGGLLGCEEEDLAKEEDDAEGVCREADEEEDEPDDEEGTGGTDDEDGVGDLAEP